MKATTSDSFDCVLKAYEGFSSPDPGGRQQLANMCEFMKSTFHGCDRSVSKAGSNCLSSYVAAELDYQAAGTRGIGRMSDAIPRFAAAHRNEFSNFSPSVLAQFGWSIERHILCGYLFYDIIPFLDLGKSRGPFDESTFDNESLFDRWLPLIYSPPSRIKSSNEGERQVEDIWFGSTGKPIHDLAMEHNLRWDDDTDRLITTCYFTAGKALRFAEAMFSAGE